MTHPDLIISVEEILKDFGKLRLNNNQFFLYTLQNILNKAYSCVFENLKHGRNLNNADEFVHYVSNRVKSLSGLKDNLNSSSEVPGDENCSLCSIYFNTEDLPDYAKYCTDSFSEGIFSCLPDIEA